ncbi:MAG: signal peptidase II [Lachnospiraceae bacterium]|nr:signal peptidase II [Lachnospiraceae bacterium]
MNNMDKLIENLKYKLWAVVVFPVLLFLDQYSKEWARDNLSSGAKELIKGVLELRYSENRGAVWGFAQGSVTVMAVISIIIFLIVLFIYVKIPYGKHYIPLHILAVFVLAGAAGNLIDRILMKYVTDFIYIKLINFPIFNVADVYITFSAFLIVVFSLTLYRKEEFEFLHLSSGSAKKDQEQQKNDVADQDETA